MSQPIDRCRVCAGRALASVLDLGRQPLANSLRADVLQPLQRFPLEICRCEECGTVQLTETVPPEELFTHYLWVTGTSAGAREYSRLFCERIVERAPVRRLFVLEVASNDGTFLGPFLQRGDRVLGIDPARNVATLARDAGIPTRAEFFGFGPAKAIVEREGLADVVFARNVIPHVPDPNDVLAGMAHCLAPDGVGAIEFHRADIILDELHYDSIYHEHVFYHSLHSVTRLLRKFTLEPFDVAESPISGGSLVVYFSKTVRPAAAAFTSMWNHEESLGIERRAAWQEFGARCDRHRLELRALVHARRAAHKTIIGYGASARSSTLLNYCGIGRAEVEAVADRNSLKHDRYTPGSDIPIVDPDLAFRASPDVVLMLAWNFRDEILEQIQAEQHWRGEVIVPLPHRPAVLRVA